MPQNHELVSETVVGLEALYSVRLKGGGTVESRQTLTTDDENHRAVAKKFGVRSIHEQLAAKKIAWADVLPPLPAPPDPVVAEKQEAPAKRTAWSDEQSVTQAVRERKPESKPRWK